VLRGQDTGRALGATRPEMEESHTARDAREREREAKEGWAFFPTSLKMFSILRTVLHKPRIIASCAAMALRIISSNWPKHEPCSFPTANITANSSPDDETTPWASSPWPIRSLISGSLVALLASKRHLLASKRHLLASKRHLLAVTLASKRHLLAVLSNHNRHRGGREVAEFGDDKDDEV
jgi:hypothetical protein